MLQALRLLPSKSVFQASRCTPSNRQTTPVHVRAAAKREPKDPKNYANLEALRAELHRGKSGPAAGLSGLLNSLSDAAFGAARDKSGEIAGLYRRVLRSRWARSLNSGLAARPGYVPTPADLKADLPLDHGQQYAEPLLQDLNAAKVQHLAALLLCPADCILRMAGRYPPVLSMDPRNLLMSLLALKEIFPRCNVARMVELQPREFLEPPLADVSAQVTQVNQQLREGLAGADIDAMLEEDPEILFEPAASVATGLARLRELWPVDASALEASDPVELALAVKALSSTGPPKAF